MAITAPECPLREPQLDGLRAIALLSVFYSHFWEESSDLGHLGVRFFFVLSGFLITSILLNARAHDNHTAATIAFFARRAARIWPPYFLLLGCCWLAAGALKLPLMNESLPWHALFLSNIWYAAHGPEPWALQHLWTLAVEEQFYLIWPFVILALPSRHLLKLCGALVSCTIFYRASAFALGKVDEANALPFDSIDALAAGAALSFLAVDGRSFPRWLLWVSVPVGVVGFIMQIAFDLGNLVEWVLLEGALVLPLTAIVAVASKGQLLKILANKSLSGLGRISYGAYLYHLPLWAVLLRLSDHFGMGDLFVRGPFTMVVVGSLSTLMALASWVMLERPVMAWSKRVTNRPAPA
ncbi:acyltransferase [Rhizobium sp. WSM1274]|uniref:acyltransferase family protein n=1 Tax=Rhizobium sp. WSM1274 TaxID=3138254 RepID=UPI0021A60AA3|nr:acyltransferase [Rhizobium leguminosarum]UWU29335.1 acyltransferase [Rhizobium leguminosarum bv. viciae]